MTPFKTWQNIATKYPKVNLMRGVRYANLKMMKPPSLKLWSSFKDEIMSTPVYFINCHGSVCSSYVECGKGNKRALTPKEQKIGIPSFRVPKSTYILSLTSGDEYCLVGGRFINEVIMNTNNFRKLLLVNDRKTDLRGLDSMHPGQRSLIGSLYRATECWYPNIGCSFLDEELDHTREKEEKGAPVALGVNEVVSGVFPLDDIPARTVYSGVLQTLNNTTQSMIKIGTRGDHGRIGPYGIGTWYLDDIINHVYATTGNHKGIFVFAGCTSHYVPDSAKASEDIRKCQQLIYEADNTYGTTKPTLDAEAIRASGFPLNIPMVSPLFEAHTAYTPHGAHRNAAAGITDIGELDIDDFAPDNAEKLGLKAAQP
jgi:hypothetical protein